MKPSDQQGSQAEPLPLKGIRILLVEDSWHVAKAITRLLQALGAEVTGPAATVAEAARLLTEHRVDAAVVDFNLRGGELAHGLIDQLNDQGVRVIVVSGYEIVPVAREKVVAILQKPVKKDELLASLRTAISQKSIL